MDNRKARPVAQRACLPMTGPGWDRAPVEPFRARVLDRPTDRAYHSHGDDRRTPASSGRRGGGTWTPLLPGGNLGRYRVVKLIGRGGMAAIFKAYDPELGRHVAIKELPTYQADEAAFVEVFRREAQAVAQLNHPNIVQVYDFGEDKGFAYIVMEHLNGGTLLERMERRLPIDAVLEYIRPVAGALEYAHGRGTVHRDVKPGNILLDDDGKPILCDFGLARMLDDSDATSGTGTVTGTPEYMAPEQALGRQPDHRTDIYALAVIVYQMLLGRTPFRAGTAAATLLAYIHEPVPLPSSLDPGLDPALETVLIKGLAKSPADRCLAATDLVNALAGEDSQPETRAGFVTTAQDYLSTQTDLAKWANLPEPKKAPVLGGDPQFIREGRSFPQLGISFLKRISRAGQWETVRLVYTNPPASTEQIFHPEKYQTGEKPVVVALPDLDVVLGEEWTEVFSSVLGERLLKDYLASLNGSDPEEAAAGWGGDRFSLYRGPGGAFALAEVVVWDTAEDAREFFDYVEAGAAGEHFVGVGEDRVLLVLGPNEDIVNRIRSQFSGY